MANFKFGSVTIEKIPSGHKVSWSPTGFRIYERKAAAIAQAKHHCRRLYGQLAKGTLAVNRLPGGHEIPCRVIGKLDFERGAILVQGVGAEAETGKWYADPALLFLAE